AFTSGTSRGTSGCMRKALALETTACPAVAKRGSSSAATAASSAEKISLGAPEGSAEASRIVSKRDGMGVFRRQRAAAPYSRSVERSDAASQVISNQGWFSNN